MGGTEWAAMAVLTAVWLLAGAWATPAGRGRIPWLLVGVVALCVRFAASWFILGNHGDSAGTDGLLYHKVAIRVMEQLRAGVPLWRVDYDYTWYTLLLGVQYALAGANRYLGCYMNALYAVLCGQVLLRTGTAIGFSFRRAAITAGVWLFMPSLVIWTADTRKEGISLLFAMALWCLAVRLLKRRMETTGTNPEKHCRLDPCPVKSVRLVVSSSSPRRSRRRDAGAMAMILAICLLLWVSTLLRIYMLLPLGAGLLATFGLQWLWTRQRRLLLYTLVVMATIGLFGVKSVLPRMENNHALAVERTAGGDEDMTDEYAGVLGRLLERDIPRAINGFFTEPHPGSVEEISDLQGQPLASAAVVAEMLLWYAAMICAIFGMMDGTLRRDAFLIGLIVFIALYSGINILIAENISDTYYRYRAFIVAPVFLFCNPLPAFRRWLPPRPREVADP